MPSNDKVKKFFWLSFCDPDKPKGSQFLGANIIEASDAIMAHFGSGIYGCNPGGEVKIIEIPQTANDMFDHVKDTNRLLSAKEIEERWGIVKLENFHA
jgi:hypothetical protein